MEVMLVSRLEIIQRKLKELKLYREYLLNIKTINGIKNENIKIKKLDK